MNIIRVIFLFTTLIGINKTNLLAQVTGKVVDEKTLTQLNQFRSDYIKSKLEEKPDLISAYYDSDIRLMTEFQKTVLGKNNVIAYYNAFAARLRIKSYRRDAYETLDLEAMVVETGKFSMKGILASGNDFELNGKYINVWKRTNAKLLLIADGWNYNHQVDLGDQLHFTYVPVVDVALQAHVPINNPVSFELAALNRLQETVISERDDKMWAQFYATDAILFSQFHELNTGRKEIDRYIEEHAADRPIFEKLDIRNDRIDDLGHYVIEYASHIAIWRRGDYSGVNLGKDVRIWRREPNGSLKIFRHMGMYD